MPNSSQPKNWRDVLPIHPAAELFPLMSQSELRELGEDIRTNGLLSPIILDDGELVDGRNRLDAIELVGMEFEFIRAKQGPRKGKIVGIGSNDFDTGLTSSVRVMFDVSTEADPYAFVIAANLHRRHLTPEQKRDLIAKVLKAKPEQSNRKIAKQANADDKTVANVRRGLEATAEIPKLKKTIGADGKSRPKAKNATGSAAKSTDAQVSAPSSPLDLVAQAISLVEQMTASQRQDFVAWLKTSGLIGASVLQSSAEVSVEQRKSEHAALDEIPDDLSIPAFLQRERQS